jgi:tetratricopeptide (TPR) repeat protein
VTVRSPSLGQLSDVGTTGRRGVLLGLLATAIVAVPLLFTKQAANPFSVVQLMTAALLVGAAVVAWGLVAAEESRLDLPTPVVCGVLGALMVALVLATVTADRPWAAVVGAESRNSGLLLYLLCMLALLTTHAAVVQADAGRLLAALALLGVVQLAISVAQLAGVQWPDLTQVYATPVIGTLGNPNFVSAVLGITVPALLWFVVRHDLLALRLLAGATALAALAVAWQSGSVQGPVAGAAGAVVLVLGGNWPALRRAAGAASTAMRAGAALGAVVLLLVLVWLGQAVLARGTLEVRQQYWAVAWRMFRDAPLLGVGLDRYGAHFNAARSPDVVDALGTTGFANAAHSVPLHMLAGGGLVLGLAYLALVLVTGVALLTGLARSRDDVDRRWALAAAGGCWAAYQTQSLVSIDQPPLALLHFVLAGLVLALAWPDRRTTMPVLGAAALLVSVPLVLGLVYLASLPLRSELAIRDGNLALRAQDGATALEEYQSAADVAPWDPRPDFYRGRLLSQAGDPAQSFTALRKAAEDEPGEAPYALAAAIAALKVGDAPAATELAEQAAKADPLGPDTLTDAGIVLVNAGRPEEGRALLERVVQRGSPLARTWAGLGDAQLAAGDAEAARQSYQLGLALEPGNAAIQARLDQLPPPA